MLSVLVVDDEPALRSIVTSWVEREGLTVHEATSAEHALEVLEDTPIDIAICDVNLPYQDGVWLGARIRERHRRTAIVMATSVSDVDTAVASLRNSAVDYVLKPFDRERLLEALALAREWHAATAGTEQFQQALADRLRSRRASIAATLSGAQESFDEALEGLMAMLQFHAADARGHATRVARIAVAMAEEMGLDEAMLTCVQHGALLHDVGKLEMPESILTKPAPLDEREWRLMRTHPQVGYDLVRKQPRFADAAELVLAHHEAYDGSGYPRGLRAEQIPLGARILTVADAYDSMTHPHTQRPQMPASMAVQEIERCNGRQFDPSCVNALGGVLARAAAEFE